MRLLKSSENSGNILGDLISQNVQMSDSCPTVSAGSSKPGDPAFRSIKSAAARRQTRRPDVVGEGYSRGQLQQGDAITE